MSWGMYLSFSNSKFILSNLSIYLFYLVQIGEGAKLRFAPLGQEAPASVQIASGSKRCQRGILSDIPLILAVSYFKDMLITLINETYKLGGFLTDG